MKPITVNDKLKINYDHYYESGKSEWRWLGALDKTQNIVNLCGLYAHKTILEIGSGDGSILKRLSDLKFGDELTSLEISKSAMETIKSRNIKPLTECKLFDGYNIPYQDNQFDLAVLSHIVEHLEYPRKLLYEAARVARYVFLEVPSEDTLRLKDDYVFNKVGHINFYSPKTIRRLVQTCDLEVLKQSVTNPSFSLYRYQSGLKGVLRYLPKQVLLKVAPRLATHLFTYHCAIVCQKPVHQTAK
jgi:ubiquinone/menaquinone biosynthesis C-methylase UbiE